MSRKVYEVDVKRDGKFWLIHVPSVDRSTQARNLQELDAMARDLVVIMDDVAADSFDLDIVVKVPPTALAHLEESQRLRNVSLEANAQAALELRLGARGMAEEGFTVRDIGRLLGISHQRVHQLVHDEAAAVRVAPRPAVRDRFYGGGESSAVDERARVALVAG